MASKRRSKLGMQLHFICRHTALTSIQSSNYFPNSKPCCGRSLHILSRTRPLPSTACARLSLLVCAISLGLSVLHSSPTQDMVSLIGKRSRRIYLAHLDIGERHRHGIDLGSMAWLGDAHASGLHVN